MQFAKKWTEKSRRFTYTTQTAATDFCEREWKEEIGERKKGRNSQVRDPRTFEGNSQGKDPSTFEGRSHQVEKLPVQEKRKEEQWKKRKRKKKKKKLRFGKRKRWKKCKERVASFSSAKRKERG